MSCEDEWKRVRELAGRAAKADQAYAVVKAQPLTPERIPAIAEARERCNQADQALGGAMQAAIRAQRQH